MLGRGARDEHAVEEGKEAALVVASLIETTASPQTTPRDVENVLGDLAQGAAVDLGIERPCGGVRAQCYNVQIRPLAH